jgi:hypothetical protein
MIRGLKHFKNGLSAPKSGCRGVRGLLKPFKALCADPEKRFGTAKIEFREVNHA